MYYCPDCGSSFEKPEKSYERHSLDNPPYEKIYLCPKCLGDNFFEKSTTHCRCCGAKLRTGLDEYCSDACRKKGEKLWKREIKRRKLILSNPLNQIIKELKIYNQLHSTNYSYGQYIALIRPQEVKKNDK